MPARVRNTTHCQLVRVEWKGDDAYIIEVRSSTLGDREHGTQEFALMASNGIPDNKCQQPLTHPGLPPGTTCQMGFSSKSQLNAHIKAVHNLELFECPYDGCRKLVLDGSNLNKHEKSCKKRPASKPIVPRFCKNCNRSFSRSDNLRRHSQGCKNTQPSPPPPSPPADQTALLTHPGEEFEEMWGIMGRFSPQDDTNASGPTALGMQEQEALPMAATSAYDIEEQLSHYPPPPTLEGYQYSVDVAYWSAMEPDTAREDMPSICSAPATVVCTSVAGVLPSTTEMLHERTHFGTCPSVSTVPSGLLEDYFDFEKAEQDLKSGRKLISGSSVSQSIH